MKTIDNLRKFAEGGKVRKYEEGGESVYDTAYKRALEAGASPNQAEAYAEQLTKESEGFTIAEGVAGAVLGDSAASTVSGMGTAFSRIGAGEFGPADPEKLKKSVIASGVVSEGVQLVDNLTMGDKNFGAQSEAIDGAVHGVSGALMKSGNPYAMIAAGALEGINFLTKAGGQTVQGFNVDINSSGYGDLGHMDSYSSRNFLGIGNQNIEAKLKKRNEQAQMAMNAANIANEQKFEQEARANSIQNTIMNNQIALAGGMDTSLLGG